MSSHFRDARYHLRRAAEHATAGIREELEPVRQRLRELLGREVEEPEPSGLDGIQSALAELESGAEGEASRAIAAVRERIRRSRRGGPDETA